LTPRLVGTVVRMTDNAPVLIEELDRRNDARRAAPGDQAAEMALWEAAARLGLWFVVNNGTTEEPRPTGLQLEGVGSLIAVYSNQARAQAAAGEGTVLGVPMPAALDWLASYAQRGVSGIVLDHPGIGAWIPLANLSYLKRWVPAGQALITTKVVTDAPDVQPAMDAYRAEQNDDTYTHVLRLLLTADLLVVVDPGGDGTAPTHNRNGRGERVALAFTDSTRLAAFYEGKAVDVQQRPAAGVLALVAEQYDVLVIDPQHPSSFAATPEWIRGVLDETR
jgi:hypothetical protein